MQIFWRCAGEHSALGTGEAGQAHKQRLLDAMRGLTMEIAEGRRPEPGTPERRESAIARSAVWELDTRKGVESMLARFDGAALALSRSQVGTIHRLFEERGRGSARKTAHEDANALLQRLSEAAQATLLRPDPAGAPAAEQRTAACVALALSEYIGAHRGTEKRLAMIKRAITGGSGSFNAGKDLWSNRLAGKDKQAILGSARRHLEQLRAEHPEAPSSESVDEQLKRLFPKLTDPGSKQGALELLEEALQVRAQLLPEDAAAAEGLNKLATVKDDVVVAQGGPLTNREQVRLFLHDAIDRTELGDRMDTVKGTLQRLTIPLSVPTKIGTFTANVSVGPSTGTIMNVQANNDCVQLTLGTTREAGVSVGGGYRGDLGVGDVKPKSPVQQTDDTQHSKRPKLTGPGGQLRYEYKNRHDPAVVLKCSIEPVNGLRDLGEARQRLKEAVDVLLGWQDLRDAQGQRYTSVLEAMADRLDPPPRIDWETRGYKTHGLEATISLGGSVDVAGGLRAGLMFSGKGGITNDVMISANQQGGEEKYDTTRCAQRGAVPRCQHAAGRRQKEAAGRQGGQAEGQLRSQRQRDGRAGVQRGRLGEEGQVSGWPRRIPRLQVGDRLLQPRHGSRRRPGDVLTATGGAAGAGRVQGRGPGRRGHTEDGSRGAGELLPPAPSRQHRPPVHQGRVEPAMVEPGPAGRHPAGEAG